MKKIIAAFVAILGFALIHGCDSVSFLSSLPDSMPLRAVEGLKVDLLRETGMWPSVEWNVDYVIFSSDREELDRLCSNSGGDMDVDGCAFQRGNQNYIVVADIKTKFLGADEKEWEHELGVAQTMLHEALHFELGIPARGDIKKLEHDHAIIAGLENDLRRSYLLKHPELMLDIKPVIADFALESGIESENVLVVSAFIFPKLYRDGNLFRFINGENEVFVYHKYSVLTLPVGYIWTDITTPLCLKAAVFIGELEEITLVKSERIKSVTESVSSKQCLNYDTVALK